MKTCTKCGEEKHLSEFHKSSSSNDGLHTQCKSCRCLVAKVKIKQWVLDNQEKSVAYGVAYRLKNKEKWNKKTKVWIESNQERHSESMRAWRKANPEAMRIYKQNRRSMERERGRLSVGLSGALFSMQKGKCPCCGEPLGDDYHLDHIMPLALGGTNTDDNMQLLRATCNHQKNAKHPVDYMQSKGFLI